MTLDKQGSHKEIKDDKKKGRYDIEKKKSCQII